MNISIRKETPADYRIVEELTRDAFWGNLDHSTCDGEHLLVHKLRTLPSFVEELDLVAEVEGKIAGHVIYSLAKVIMPDGREIEVLNFGPLSVHPDYKGLGVGSALMRYSISKAAGLGYRAIIFYGHPDYYPRFGFRRAGRYGIVSSDGNSFDALMAMELYDGALDGITGRFIEDEVYEVDPDELAAFEKGFPYKEPVQLLPAKLLTDQLPEQVKQTFAQHEIGFVAQLQRYSGAELLNWDGMEEQLLMKINGILSRLGQPCKLLPSSYILQLTELGVRNPVCELMRSKAGISLYRVESEGKKLILKVFENQENAREIDNYLLLSKLDIPTLSLLGYTQNAILLPVQLLPAKLLTDQLPEQVKQTFAQHEIGFVAQLQRYSGAELLNWDGMEEQLLMKINGILSRLGQPCKLLPSSYILQLTELGVRNPVCELMRSKAGISLYRVESEGKKLILKVFENQENAREIDNYLLLSKLDIPTLSLLGYTQNAILLPDVEAGGEYRLGKESDLRNTKVAGAIARWYTSLHKKGRVYFSGSESPMYDESDVLTTDNMGLIAEKTGTAENILWHTITENYGMIRSRIDALPRTLTYNDFYWTNLIVSKTGESAFMFDYNLLGKGIAYGDVRNVTGSLSHEAEEAFIQEYGDDIDEEQKRADTFIAPLVTLANACRYETFPSWAEASLEELKNGDILKHLKEWLRLEGLE